MIYEKITGELHTTSAGKIAGELKAGHIHNITGQLLIPFSTERGTLTDDTGNNIATSRGDKITTLEIFRR